MKLLLSSIILTFSLTIFSQNMIYFERQSPYNDFSTGNGVIELKTLGLSSTIDVLIKYKQYNGGNPASTGWIPHTGNIYNDIYDDTIYAVGVYYGDTLIRSKHLFDPNNYEVIDATAFGFDNHGLYDLSSNEPYEIILTFDGPTSNGDAEIGGLFSTITSINNVLTINNTTSPIPPLMSFVSFNNGKSRVPVRITDVNSVPRIPTNNSLLNAYIPRINSRPNTINDCDGDITFERFQLINDVNLEYAINGSNYTPLTNDNFTGLCAYDTISILGYSPTIMPGDTLVRTQYVLRSADSIGQYDFDLSEISFALNQNVTDPTNCSNSLTFTHFQGTSTEGLGLLTNEFDEILTVNIDPGFNEFESICQAQYFYSGTHFGINPSSPFISFDFSEYASLTIVNENDSVLGIPVNFDVSQQFTDSLSCTSDILVERTTTPNYSILVSYTQYDYNTLGPFYEEGAMTSIGINEYTSSVSDLCPGMYHFQQENRRKLVFITDSLQQLDMTYRELLGDGSEPYLVLPEVDTLKLYYEECDNDYSLPFTTVDYNKTNSEVTGLVNTSYNVEEFSSSFNLTQGANSFYLHERPVMMPDYTVYPNPQPYHIVTELFCEDPLKSITKRRKLIIAPDGTITDLYEEGTASLDKEATPQEFSVYPNPSNHEITIKSAKDWNSYSLVNMSGEIVLNGENRNNLNKFKLSINHLDNGVYILQLNGNQFSSKKLVVKQ